MTTPTTTIDKNFSYFYNAFLSYSKESEYEAKRLYKILRLNGLRVWFDLYEINKTSKFYKDEISIALKYTPVFICLINEYYVNSINCYNEIVYAFKSNKIIIALRMERCHLIKYNYIGFILSLSNKCNLYEDNEEFFKNVRGTAYDQLLSIIRTLFKSKGIRLSDKFGSDIRYKYKLTDLYDLDSDGVEVNKMIQEYRSESFV